MTTSEQALLLDESLRRCACATLFQAVRDLETDCHEPVLRDTKNPIARNLATQSHARYRQSLEDRMSAILWLSGSSESSLMPCEVALNSARIKQPQLPLSRTAFFAWALGLEAHGVINQVFASVTMSSCGPAAPDDMGGH